MRTIPEKESTTIEFKSDRSGYSDADPVGAMALIANKTIPSVSVRAEIIEEEGLSVLKIEISRWIMKPSADT